jgi:hypothetical protein
VTLVDLDGMVVPSIERATTPYDPWDSPYWDVWHYEISAADQAEFDRWLHSIDDVPPPEDEAEPVRRWLDSKPSFGDWLDSEGGAAP